MQQASRFRRARRRQRRVESRGARGARPGEGFSDYLDENDNQGIERQRFDQHQAQQQGEADGGGGTGIARHPFGGGGGGLGLRQSAQAGGNRHGEPGGDGSPLGVSLSDGAGIGRDGLSENHGAGNKQQCEHPHYVFLSHPTLLKNRPQEVVPVILVQPGSR